MRPFQPLHPNAPDLRSISGVTFRPLNPNTPGLLCIEGVWFVLHEDRSRLYSFGFTCKFCGVNRRTCSTASREESMRKHAAKADHGSVGLAAARAEAAHWGVIGPASAK